MYNALCARCHAFGAAELDRYDHLFYGTHLVLLGAIAADGLRDMCIESHRLAATGNAHALRGIWRKQQVFFETDHPGIPQHQVEQIRADMLSTVGAMAQWSGKDYSKAELWQSIERTVQSIDPRLRRAPADQEREVRAAA
jgi:hypothetical protein